MLINVGVLIQYVMLATKHDMSQIDIDVLLMACGTFPHMTVAFLHPGIKSRKLANIDF